MVPVHPQPFAGIPGLNIAYDTATQPMRGCVDSKLPDRSFVFNNRIGSLGIGCSEAFRQIGHSFATLIVATLGGLFARSRYHVRVRDGQCAEPESP